MELIGWKRINVVCGMGYELWGMWCGVCGVGYVKVVSCKS